MQVKKFVYASSSSVYGDEPNLPKTEGREGNLLSPYALTKRCDEEWARQYTLHYSLDTYGLRYFNVFGRRQNPDGAYAAVIPKFIKMLINDEVPTINGDGKQSRDFTYIDNVNPAVTFPDGYVNDQIHACNMRNIEYTISQTAEYAETINYINEMKGFLS